jgi:hypothetical protein
MQFAQPELKCMATSKQIEYANYLLERHEENGTLEDMVHELCPKFGEDEDFEDWFKDLPVSEASSVISELKQGLENRAL